MLPLDDARWATLHAGGGSADDVPRWLRRLRERPDDTRPLRREGWALCSDEVTWSAAFAAAPHLVAAVRAAGPAARLEYLCFLGMLVMYQVPAGDADQYTACPPDLEPAFREAVAAAEGFAAGALGAARREPDVRWLLAALAAFKGFPGLARGITDVAHEGRRDEPPEEIPF
jgi:hypothetical protein